MSLRRFSVPDVTGHSSTNGGPSKFGLGEGQTAQLKLHIKHSAATPARLNRLIEMPLTVMSISNLDLTWMRFRMSITSKEPLQKAIGQ
jgi:hypothetical protein